MPICFMPSALLRYGILDPMLLATQGTIDGGCMVYLECIYIYTY